jgi:hypothetical protein
MVLCSYWQPNHCDLGCSLFYRTQIRRRGSSVSNDSAELRKVTAGISCAVCTNSTSELVNYLENTILFMMKTVHKTVPKNLY